MMIFPLTIRLFKQWIPQEIRIFQEMKEKNEVVPSGEGTRLWERDFTQL